MVVATGSDTELGRINQLMAGVSALETPLLRQIKKFGYAITAVIAVVSVIVFAYGRWVQGMDFVEIFQAVVGIAVSVIPEGLPALITITLAIGVQRMAQRNAIIRRLPAVETLGSVSRICSDKTGTLTLDGDDGGVGRHRRLDLSDHRRRLCTRRRGPEGRQAGGRGPGSRAAWGASPCSATTRSSSRRKEPGRWRAIRPKGRSTRSRNKLGLERQGRAGRVSADRRHPVRIGTQVHGDAAQDGRRQGSCCWSRARRKSSSSIAIGSRPADGQPAPIDREHFTKASDKLAAQGERVLALAWLENPDVKAGSLSPADLPEEPRPARPDRPARSAAQGSYRGGQGMPCAAASASR